MPINSDGSRVHDGELGEQAEWIDPNPQLLIPMSKYAVLSTWYMVRRCQVTIGFGTGEITGECLRGTFFLQQTVRPMRRDLLLAELRLLLSGLPRMSCAWVAATLLRMSDPEILRRDSHCSRGSQRIRKTKASDPVDYNPICVEPRPELFGAGSSVSGANILSG